MTTLYPAHCSQCQEIALLPALFNGEGYLCPNCQPRPSRLLALFLSVWQPIRSRLRWTVAAVAVMIYVVAVGSMAMVYALR